LSNSAKVYVLLSSFNTSATLIESFKPFDSRDLESSQARKIDLKSDGSLRPLTHKMSEEMPRCFRTGCNVVYSRTVSMATFFFLLQAGP